jgi:carboxypeptidase C (cathepsin A)
MSSTEQPARPAEPPASPPRHRGLLLALGAGFLALGLAIGASIGAAANSHASQLNTDRVHIHTLQVQVQSLQSKLTRAYTQVATAQNNAAAAAQKASTATSRAQAAAAAQYASREAAVKRLLRKLQREQGVVMSNTISASGVYVVGKDIQPGVYHTSGSGGGGIMNQCYYATLGSTDTSNILDNNNFNGPETVDVSGAYAFQIDGGCTWHLVP